MKIFTALFDMAVLPAVVAMDAITALPDASMGIEPFSRSRAQCEKIDEDISK